MDGGQPAVFSGFLKPVDAIPAGLADQVAIGVDETVLSFHGDDGTKKRSGFGADVLKFACVVPDGRDDEFAGFVHEAPFATGF